jgi:hypothetical protein
MYPGLPESDPLVLELLLLWLVGLGQEKSDAMTPAVRHEWPEWLEQALSAMPDAERDALAGKTVSTHCPASALPR